ncbi:unnamed protein product [Prunus armeniaca]
MNLAAKTDKNQGKNYYKEEAIPFSSKLTRMNHASDSEGMGKPNVKYSKGKMKWKIKKTQKQKWVDRMQIIEAGVSWVIPQGYPSLISESLAAFGKGNKARVLWGCCKMAVLWVIWMKGNERMGIEELWERVMFLSSHWASVTSDFRDLFLYILLNWESSIGECVFVSHVRFSGLLVELNTNDSFFAVLTCVLDQHTSIPILPLAWVLLLGVVLEPGLDWEDVGSGTGGRCGQEAELRQVVTETGKSGRVEWGGEAVAEDGGRKANTGS